MALDGGLKRITINKVHMSNTWEKGEKSLYQKVIQKIMYYLK